MNEIELNPWLLALILAPLLAFVLNSTRQETNEDWVRTQWSRHNRHLRSGRIDMKEFQWLIESEIEYLGEEEWYRWLKKIRLDGKRYC